MTVPQPVVLERDGRPDLLINILGGHVEPDVAVTPLDLEDGDLLLLGSAALAQVEPSALQATLVSSTPSKALDAIERLLPSSSPPESAGALLLRIRRREAPACGRTPIVSYAARTHVGIGRARNEDAFQVVADRGVFALADGMGGHRDGALAARTAVESLAASLSFRSAPDRGLLSDAFEHAHYQVSAATRGGATTAEVLIVRDGRIVVGHVGDSRVYRWREGSLEQLTNDHSVVGELVRQGRLTEEAARRHPRRNIVTKALGGDLAEPDVLEVDAVPGDIFLLCSDGLHGIMEAAAIGRVLAEYGRLDDACRKLIGAALDAGAPDNVTLVLVRIEQ